jgi:hypothetical protein
VPVITVAGAVPAMATSPPPGTGALEFDLDGSACNTIGGPACKNIGIGCDTPTDSLAGTYAFDFKVNATGPICIVITEVTISNVSPCTGNGAQACTQGVANRVLLEGKNGVTVNGCTVGASPYDARISATQTGCVRVVAGDYRIPRGTDFFATSQARMVVQYDVYDPATGQLLVTGQKAPSGAVGRSVRSCSDCPSP